MRRWGEDSGGINPCATGTSKFGTFDGICGWVLRAIAGDVDGFDIGIGCKYPSMNIQIRAVAQDHAIGRIQAKKDFGNLFDNGR